MNPSNPSGTPPNLPAGFPGASGPPPLMQTNPGYSQGELPPGTDAVERTPIVGVIGAVEAILRQPRRVMYQLKQARPGGLILSLVVIAAVCSLIYGLVVGSFSGGEQTWAAPLKVAAGVLISGIICLPSLYIFACLCGSQARLVEVSGLVAGLLGLVTILLIGFAPVAWVFSQSTETETIMGALHLAFWMVALCFGVRFLRAAFRHIGTRSGGALATWTVIFTLVCLQMTTALRPLIGKSDRFLPAATQKKFFLSHWIDCLEEDTRYTGSPGSAGRNLEQQSATGTER